MTFSEVELVFLAFIFIYALIFLMLGRNNSTSTAKKTKKKRKGKDTRGQKLSKHSVRSGQMKNVFILMLDLAFLKCAG